MLWAGCSNAHFSPWAAKMQRLPDIDVKFGLVEIKTQKQEPSWSLTV